MKNLFASQFSIVFFFIALFVLSHDGFAQAWDNGTKIVSSDRGQQDQFGWSVAVDDSTMVICADFEKEDENGQNTLSSAGSTYIYKLDGAGNWVQSQKIVPSDRQFADVFGYAVDLDGDRMIIGAYDQDFDANGQNQLSNSGAAYIFKRNSSGVWEEEAKLVASDRRSGDRFGLSVSIDGDYAIVGAYTASFGNSNDSLKSAGAAYVYKHDGNGNWPQQQKLVPNDRAFDNFFGISVAIDGDDIMVGSYSWTDASGANSIINAGAVYVFQRSSNTWNQTQKLVATHRAGGAIFGGALSMDNDQAVVGALYDPYDVNGSDSILFAGAIYVLEKSNTTWQISQKLVASDRSYFSIFGSSVAIYGDYLVTGARFDSFDEQGQDSMFRAGSAYIFKKGNNGQWSEQKKLVASERAAGDYMGVGVAISYQYVVVGAAREDEDEDEMNTLFDAGSAFVFERNTASINEYNTLALRIAPNPTNDNIHLAFTESYKEITVSVYGMDGKLISSEKHLGTQDIVVKLPTQKGLYFINVTDENRNQTTEKVIKS